MMAVAEPNATVLPATDYGQGFGSFNFPNSAPWRLLREVRRMKRAKTTSNPRQELNASSQETATPFPFMRLPKEIREKILRYFTEPLLVQRALRVFETQDTPLPPTATQFWSISRSRDTSSARNSQQGDGAPTSRIIIPNTTTGPWCNSSRKLRLACTCLFPTFDECLQVNILSQVSRQLTYELGACLWKNAAVTFQDPEEFIEFANSRPVALTFVKGILIILNCDDDHTDSFPSRRPTTTPPLLRMMQKINDSDIDLNFFRVLLNGSGKYHANRGFDMEGKIAKWAPAFQSLKTRQFDVVPGAIIIEDVTSVRLTPNIDSFPHTLTQTEAWNALVSLWKPKSIQENENTPEAIYERLRDLQLIEDGEDEDRQNN